MDWSEQLPEECPPKEAESPEGYIVYRIAATNPPTDEDFKSHRSLFPNKYFSVGECRAMSLSVYDNLDITKQVTKLPVFQGKQNVIIKLNLKDKDGLIMKTSGPSHYSWWKSQNFEFIAKEEF